MKSALRLLRMAFWTPRVTFHSTVEPEEYALLRLTESSKEPRSVPFAPAMPQLLTPSYVVQVAPSAVQLARLFSQTARVGALKGLLPSVNSKLADSTA